MVGAKRTPERLVALFLFGVMLMFPPILEVFNQPVRILGVPVLYLYVFAAWAVLIVLVAAIVRRISLDEDDTSGTADPDVEYEPSAAPRDR